MAKWTLTVLLLLSACTLHSQVNVSGNIATVTVVVGGTTYTGQLQAAGAVPIGTGGSTTGTANSQNSSSGDSAPRLTPSVPVAPTPPQLPAMMMTTAWPLNQPALQYPDETRSLNSSYGDGNYTPKPIASAFKGIFGPNHVVFDTTMPWSAIDSRQTPDVFVDVAINHPDWGSDDGTTCSAMTQGATVSTHWPAKAGVIEGANNPTGDHHVLVLDTATSRLYELFGVSVTNAGSQSAAYSADAARCWNVAQPSQGALGQNSADAAGLPIVPLLLRYDEASSGSIQHALRFTMNLTRANGNGGVFTLPASHSAGNNWSSPAYMGMRLRLRADFDASAYSAINQTIVQALKTYGIVVADNGLSGLVTADSDTRWNGDDLNMLSQALTLNDFIPVNSGPIIDSTGANAQ